MPTPPRVFPQNAAPLTFTTGVKYVGPATRLIEQSKYDLKVDEFGAVQLNRDWVLRRDKTLAQFLPNKGDYDHVYGPNVTVYDFEVKGGMPSDCFETLSVNFTGFLTSPPTKLVREESTRLIREQQIFAGPLKSGGSLIMRYITPVVTRKWAQDARWKPQSPYKVDNFNYPDSEIQFINIVSASGVIIEGTGIDQLLKFFDYKVLPYRTDLRQEQVGRVIYVTEVIEKIIAQTVFLDSKLLNAGTTTSSLTPK